MIKVLLYLIFTCNVLFAYTYEHQILQIHAKIAPRIILMSESYTQRSENIKIVIVYEKGDENSAQILKSYMQSNYPNGLNMHPLEIEKISYDSFEDAPKDALIFLLDGEKIHLQKILSFTKKNNILTMSYHYNYLQYGVIVSLYVGKSVKPYLNIQAAKNSGIVFQNNLIAISKIFYPKEQP